MQAVPTLRTSQLPAASSCPCSLHGELLVVYYLHLYTFETELRHLAASCVHGCGLMRSRVQRLPCIGLLRNSMHTAACRGAASGLPGVQGQIHMHGQRAGDMRGQQTRIHACGPAPCVWRRRARQFAKAARPCTHALLIGRKYVGTSGGEAAAV